MKENTAYDYFENKKYNCCESMLMAYGEDCGIPADMVPRLGSGFGAGMARQGLICGVVTGTTILLGAKYGRKRFDDKAGTPNTFAKTKEFMDKFQEKFGSLYCKKITGHNLSEDAKYQEWADSGGRSKCAELVREAALIIEEVAEL